MTKEIMENKKQDALTKEWIEMCKEFQTEFSQLPIWAQEILLRDMSTAFRNRISVIQKVKSLPDYSRALTINTFQRT